MFRLQVTSGSDHITDVIVNLILKIWADSASSASDFPSFKDLSCLKSVKLLMSACWQKAQFMDELKNGLLAEYE